MRNRLASFILASAALAGGCTTAGTTPATAPPVPDSTLPPTSSTVASTTVTVTGTSTTVDRLGEIQALFEDLERRRLQAIYDQDETAFRAVYANDAYLERSMVLLDAVEFLAPPDNYAIRVVEVLSDSVSCISAVIETNLEGLTVGGQLSKKTQTIEPIKDGWGISYVGEDWSCAGPHPLS